MKLVVIISTHRHTTPLTKNQIGIIMKAITINTKKFGTITLTVHFHSCYTSLKILDSKEGVIVSVCLEEAYTNYFVKTVKHTFIDAYKTASSIEATYIVDGEKDKEKEIAQEIKTLKSIMKCKEVASIYDNVFEVYNIEGLIH